MSLISPKRARTFRHNIWPKDLDPRLLLPIFYSVWINTHQLWVQEYGFRECLFVYIIKIIIIIPFLVYSENTKESNSGASQRTLYPLSGHHFSDVVWFVWVFIIQNAYGVWFVVSIDFRLHKDRNSLSHTHIPAKHTFTQNTHIFLHTLNAPSFLAVSVSLTNAFVCSQQVSWVHRVYVCVSVCVSVCVFIYFLLFVDWHAVFIVALRFIYNNNHNIIIPVWAKFRQSPVTAYSTNIHNIIMTHNIQHVPTINTSPHDY